MLNLSQALRITASQSIAIVGAGGKTSAMFAIARELTPALVTTSTHVGEWQTSMADRHFIWLPDAPIPDIEPQIGAGITLVTGPIEPGRERYQSLSEPQMEKLTQLAGYHNLPLLIEADGSRQKPLKAPEEYEPVIPAFVDAVVVVVGLTGLSRSLDAETVFRPEIFGSLSGLSQGESISAAALAKVLNHPGGGLKNIPASARRLVLLNQADTIELQASANELGKLLLPVYDSVVVARLKTNPGVVLAVRENIAAVILAGGESSRYGQPKQLLDFHGKPFIRVVAEKALMAGLSPVVVVTGANADAVAGAVQGLPLQVVNNPDWQAGQSTSMKTGLLHLPANTGGAVFLLTDQPQITVELLLALVERHSQDLPAALAPYIFDQRANPVLFDRITFPDLLTVSGDKGGRAIFSKFSPCYLNWYDRRLLLDVDTPDDYQKLLNSDSLE